tara:strand:+ start:322 stop:633 length:312 start_codon:yes stop_codon:yes gene_type:complete
MNDFWSNHNIIFLIGLTLFPRISLFFCNINFSIFTLFGWLIIPRITIAVFATIYYLNSNPILVLLSWFFALSGETVEKKYGTKISYKYRTKSNTTKPEYEIIE